MMKKIGGIVCFVLFAVFLLAVSTSNKTAYTGGPGGAAGATLGSYFCPGTFLVGWRQLKFSSDDN